MVRAEDAVRLHDRPRADRATSTRHRDADFGVHDIDAAIAQLRSTTSPSRTGTRSPAWSALDVLRPRRETVDAGADARSGGGVRASVPLGERLWHVSEDGGIDCFTPRAEQGRRLARAACLGDRRRARARVLVPARMPARHVLGGRVDERGRRRALSLRRPRASRARDRRRVAAGPARGARLRLPAAARRPSRATNERRATGSRAPRSSRSRCVELGDLLAKHATRRHRAADRAGACAALGARHRLDARVQRHPPAQPRQRAAPPERTRSPGAPPTDADPRVTPPRSRPVPCHITAAARLRGASQRYGTSPRQPREFTHSARTGARLVWVAATRLVSARPVQRHARSGRVGLRECDAGAQSVGCSAGL